MPQSQGSTAFRTTLLFCLLLLLLSSVLLLTNTIPAQRRNRALAREYALRVQKKQALEQKLAQVQLRRQALRYDPIAVQREALRQQGFTTSPRDVIVR